jgi:hypothetical protein
VIALAQDPALPKATRLKAWMALMDYAYPKVAPVIPNETVSTRVEGLQRAWDAIEIDELKEAFRSELGTLPAEVRRELEELVARNGFDPLVIERLLKFKFIKRHTENQARDPVSSDPPEPFKLAAG